MGKQEQITYPLQLSSDKTELKDLVEFRYDREKKAFVKVATHLTNVPEGLAYGMKSRQEAHGTATLYTVFVVVKNGALQYSNEFPPHLRRRLESRAREIQARENQNINV